MPQLHDFAVSHHRCEPALHWHVSLVLPLVPPPPPLVPPLAPPLVPPVPPLSEVSPQLSPVDALWHGPHAVNSGLILMHLRIPSLQVDRPHSAIVPGVPHEQPARGV